MGLRLVAHYIDRNEALIASAALDAAGVPNFLESYHQLCLQGFYELAFGGFRLTVCEQDLADAVAILEEAWRRPLREGEQLVTHYYVFPPVLALATLWFYDFVFFLPFRTHSWRD